MKIWWLLRQRRGIFTVLRVLRATLTIPLHASFAPLPDAAHAPALSRATSPPPCAAPLPGRFSAAVSRASATAPQDEDAARFRACASRSKAASAGVCGDALSRGWQPLRAPPPRLPSPGVAVPAEFGTTCDEDGGEADSTAPLLSPKPTPFPPPPRGPVLLSPMLPGGGWGPWAVGGGGGPRAAPTGCAGCPGPLFACFAPLLCSPSTKSSAGRTRQRPGDWAATQARSAAAEAVFARGFFPRRSEARPRRSGRRRSSCFRLRMSLSISWRHERFGNV